MAPSKTRKARKSRARYITPPPEFNKADSQAKTLARFLILAARVFNQEFGYQFPQLDLERITGLEASSHTRILTTNEPRTLHNTVDKGPDLRGRKKALIYQDTSAILAYTEDGSISQKDRGVPWVDLTEAAGVDLPLTTHFKPTRKAPINELTVRRTVWENEGLGNFVMEEEKELNPSTAKARETWTVKKPEEKPNGEIERIQSSLMSFILVME